MIEVKISFDQEEIILQDLESKTSWLNEDDINIFLKENIDGLLSISFSMHDIYYYFDTEESATMFKMRFLT